jgi:hypothetical protein
MRIGLIGCAADDTPSALRIDGTYVTHGTNGADPLVE